MVIPKRILAFIAVSGTLVVTYPGLVAYAQTTVNIGASKDNTLYESATGALSNGAGEHFFAGRNNQASESIRRGLIAFDVAGVVPQGATITSATLTLNMSQVPGIGATPEPVSLHRTLADWGEGTSVAGGNEGGGGPATTGSATWLHRFFNSSPWSAPGGEYVSTPSATQSVAGLGMYTWGSTSGMVSDVQQWLDNPTNNYGWVLVGNETSSQTAKRFDSRENITVSDRPSLQITFLPPVSVGDENQLPHTFALRQNYPNPFNPTTRIGYEIDRTSEVTLKVYNLLGAEVATLVDGVKSPGTYEVTFDALNLSSGVYFYKLKAGANSRVRSFVLMR